MRKLALTFLLLFVLVINGFSQDTTSQNKKYQLIIKNNLLITTIGLIEYPRIVNISIEKSIKSTQSIQFSFLYGIYPKDDRDFHKHLQVVSEYRKYLKQNTNLSGFYLGTYLKLRSTKSPYPTDIPNERIPINLETLYFGSNVGYQKSIYKNLFIDLLIGTGYRIRLNDHYFLSPKFDFRANVSLGYKF